jgi:hypothetical protein
VSPDITLISLWHHLQTELDTDVNALVRPTASKYAEATHLTNRDQNGKNRADGLILPVQTRISAHAQALVIAAAVSLS